MIRMIRPCTLPSVWVGVLNGKDSPFVIDAVRFEGLHYTPSTSYNPEEYFLVRVDLCNPKTTAMAYHPKENVEHLMRRTLGVIYDALNAPVLATKEVLAGLSDEGEFLIQNVKWGCGYIDTDCIYTFRNNRFIDSVFNRSVYNVNVVDELKENSFEIKAKNEIALAYLLQFYTDGTPVVVK